MCLRGRKITSLDTVSDIGVLFKIPRSIDLYRVRHPVFEITMPLIMQAGTRNPPFFDRIQNIGITLKIPFLVDLNFTNDTADTELEKMAIHQEMIFTRFASDNFCIEQ